MVVGSVSLPCVYYGPFHCLWLLYQCLFPSSQEEEDCGTACLHVRSCAFNRTFYLPDRPAFPGLEWGVLRLPTPAFNFERRTLVRWCSVGASDRSDCVMSPSYPFGMTDFFSFQRTLRVLAERLPVCCNRTGIAHCLGDGGCVAASSQHSW